jgi:hypothetical protein
MKLFEVLQKLKNQNYFSFEITFEVLQAWNEVLSDVSPENLEKIYFEINLNGLPAGVYKLTPAVFRQMLPKPEPKFALPEPKLTAEEIKRSALIRKKCREEFEAKKAEVYSAEAERERIERQKREEEYVIIEERNARLIEEARQRMEAVKERNAELAGRELAHV